MANIRRAMHADIADNKAKENTMSNQTAVEWVVDQLSLLNLDMLRHPENYTIDEAIRRKNEILQQAKEMEREQIETAYQAGDGDAYNLEETKTWAKEYYNETYGGDK